MSVQDDAALNGPADEIEECLDEVNNFVASLVERYRSTAVTIAMSVNLQVILSALVESKICTEQQLRAYMREFERDLLDGIGI